jgi:hypothetical protein
MGVHCDEKEEDEQHRHGCVDDHPNRPGKKLGGRALLERFIWRFNLDRIFWHDLPSWIL